MNILKWLRTAVLCAVLHMLSVVVASAQSRVDSLRIDVELQDDGSATITEIWPIDVSNDISEWYLVAGNMGRMTISGLGVKDETDRVYVNEGEWDIDRSRAEKAGRCGLVIKSDGYEICWGVGSPGPHVYTLTYTLTGLVKSYEEKDGFNHMFVARDMGSSPESIVLTIRRPGLSFTHENTSIWAFGFIGEINLEDGRIVARTDEPFSKRSAMIVLAGFQKGIFHPQLTESKTFEEVRARAVEDSDYEENSDREAMIIFAIVLAVLGLLFCFAIYVVIDTIIKNKKRKKSLLGGSMKDLPWSRDIPCDGDLRGAFNVLVAFSGSKMENQRHLVAAYITRLFYRGAFEVVTDPKTLKPALKVKSFPPGEVEEEQESEDVRLERRMFGFIKEAAGDDGIIQKRELNRWSSKHGKILDKWMNDARDNSELETLKAEDVRKVYGLRKFLKDFTLIEDRGVVEVGLWNNYLIFASLYGIAGQLYNDYRKVCPEYFSLVSVEGMSDVSTATVLMRDFADSASESISYSAYSYSADRGSSGGGGGRSSWGGGGGFSGGGSGGGGR
jgi:uncharacterized membrane protein YgcG